MITIKNKGQTSEVWKKYTLVGEVVYSPICEDFIFVPTCEGTGYELDDLDVIVECIELHILRLDNDTDS